MGLALVDIYTKVVDIDYLINQIVLNTRFHINYKIEFKK